MSPGLMDNDANLCNFRGISGTVNTSQAHFKIISLHVYNSSYRPDTTNRERQQQMYNQIPITFFVDNKSGRGDNSSSPYVGGGGEGRPSNANEPQNSWHQ